MSVFVFRLQTTMVLHVQRDDNIDCQQHGHLYVHITQSLAAHLRIHTHKGAQIQVRSV